MEANMQDNKRVLTPMSVSNVLSVDQVDLIAHRSFLWTIVTSYNICPSPYLTLRLRRVK